MEKFSNQTSKRDQFFSIIVDSLTEELTQILSENIEQGWFNEEVTASVTIGNILYEIEYHSYDNNENTLVIMKPNGNDQTKNIEHRILKDMDFIQIENDAREIYNN